jgi:hypothetical protein
MPRKYDGNRAQPRGYLKTTKSAACAKDQHTKCTSLKCQCDCGHSTPKEQKSS